MTDTPATPSSAPESAPAANVSAASKAGTFWADNVAARKAALGWGGAATKSLGEMKDAFTSAGAGNRLQGFARIGSVGVGTAIAAGALHSKDADGNDRSALARVGQAVLGTGMVAGGLLAGRA